MPVREVEGVVGRGGLELVPGPDPCLHEFLEAARRRIVATGRARLNYARLLQRWMSVTTAANMSPSALRSSAPTSTPTKNISPCPLEQIQVAPLRDPKWANAQ
jgi:hypothetical protein